MDKAAGQKKQVGTLVSREIDISDINKYPEFAYVMQKKLVISVKNLSETEIEQLRYRRPPVNVINNEMLKTALEQIGVLKQQNDEIVSQLASIKQVMDRDRAEANADEDEEASMAVAGPSTRRSFGLRSIAINRESVSQFTFEPAFPMITVDWLRAREHLITREFVREIMRIIFEAEELLNRNVTGKRAPVNRTNPDNTVVKEPVDPIRVDFIRREYQYKVI